MDEYWKYNFSVLGVWFFFSTIPHFSSFICFEHCVIKASIFDSKLPFWLSRHHTLPAPSFYGSFLASHSDNNCVLNDLAIVHDDYIVLLCPGKKKDAAESSTNVMGWAVVSE